MPTPRSQTPPSTPRLSDRAKVFAYPSGIVSTGWPEVERQHRKMGIRFAWFQVAISKLALAKRADGTYAATVGGVVLSIPRQVGKTFLLCGLLFALCLIFPGMTALWTAQQLRTAKETLRAMQGFARRKSVAPFIAYVRTANGEGEVGFVNGSRILFGARDQGFGLGMADVDVLVFDEAQRLSDTALDDMLPTQNRAKNPLFFMVGTPPRPTDNGEVFTRKRNEALSGESDDMVYVEFGADAELTPSDRIDWDQVAAGNPSFPEHTPRTAILRMWKNLGADSFWREGYGIWDDLSGGWKVLKSAQWRACESAESQIVGEPVFVLDVSPMSSHACLLAAGLTADGRSHVEITSSGGVLDYRPGVEWVAPLCRAIVATHGLLELWIVAGSAAEALVPDLEDVGVSVRVLPKADYASACVRFVQRVGAGQVVHLGQRELTAAAAAGAKRTASDEGLWIWGRGRSSADVAPLVAATAGDWLAQESAYDVMASFY